MKKALVIAIKNEASIKKIEQKQQSLKEEILQKERKTQGRSKLQKTKNTVKVSRDKTGRL